MRVRNLVLIFVAIVALNLSASAQVPAASQPAALKVGVINSDLFARQNGITKLVTALRTLETEFKPKRDEIQALIKRLETLQTPPAANTPPAQLATRQDQAQSLQIEIKRKQEDARVAYAKRMSALIDPVKLSVVSALEAYGKQRGLDLLVDVAKFPDGVMLINNNADLTAAFIRDYNSKNP